MRPLLKRVFGAADLITAPAEHVSEAIRALGPAQKSWSFNTELKWERLPAQRPGLVSTVLVLLAEIVLLLILLDC
jgi:hypothetical protein